MEAKELMIGDWVLYMGYAYYRVTAVDDMIKIGSQWQPFAHFAPIPLTAEILEKNGWKYMKESELILAPKSGGFVKYKTDTHFVSISGDGVCRKNIGYVHELQHALRLCGLNDLADDFQIE